MVVALERLSSLHLKLVTGQGGGSARPWPPDKSRFRRQTCNYMIEQPSVKCCKIQLKTFLSTPCDGSVIAY